MSDRELLELAAKAAGIDAHWGAGWQSDMMFRHIPRPNSPLVANIEWSPITNNEDAFRLMVALRIDVIHQDDDDVVAAVDALVVEQPINGDRQAAARRAIVRAAAEIGRRMRDE